MCKIAQKNHLFMHDGDLNLIHFNKNSYTCNSCHEHQGVGGSQFPRINIMPNRNRRSCYSLRTFMRSCYRQQLAILQMGIGYNEFITMFYIQATFKLKNP